MKNFPKIVFSDKDIHKKTGLVFANVRDSTQLAFLLIGVFEQIELETEKNDSEFTNFNRNFVSMFNRISLTYDFINKFQTIVKFIIKDDIEIDKIENNNFRSIGQIIGSGYLTISTVLNLIRLLCDTNNLVYLNRNKVKHFLKSLVYGKNLVINNSKKTSSFMNLIFGKSLKEILQKENLLINKFRLELDNMYNLKFNTKFVIEKQIKKSYFKNKCITLQKETLYLKKLKSSHIVKFKRKQYSLQEISQCICILRNCLDKI